MRAGGVYAIVNTVNGKQYVGRTVNFSERWAAHSRLLRANEHHSTKLQRAFAKHGAAAFQFRVLWENDGSVPVEDVEQHFLSNLDCTEYNVSVSASGGPAMLGENHPLFGRKGKDHPKFGKKHSEEARAKIAAANRRRTLSTESRAKIAASLRGRAPSEETKQKMSEAGRRRFRSEEERAKQADAMRRRFSSAEERAKMSASLKGRVVAPEARAKISAFHKGRKKPPGTAAKVWATRRRNAELRRRGVTVGPASAPIPSSPPTPSASQRLASA